jgi:hypothetical protein
MKLAEQRVLAATLVFAVAVHAGKTLGQTTAATQGQSPQAQSVQSPSDSSTPESLPLGNRERSFFSLPPEASLAPQLLFDFKDSDIKFELESLMNILSSLWLKPGGNEDCLWLLDWSCFKG